MRGGFLFSMAEDESKRVIWEQREGESNAAYARFLMYRNLGPTRSIDAAYRQHQSGRAKATKSRKKPYVPGQWIDDAARFDWVERASAWDIAILNDVGRAVVVKFIHALERSYDKLLAALNDERVKPRTWEQVIESLTILGAFVPQETIADIKQSSADAARVPAFGRDGDKPNTGVTAT